MKIHRPLYVFVFVLLFSQSTRGQHFVTLSHPASDTIVTSFFIENIIDARPNKSGLGVMKDGMSLEIKLGLRNSLLSYSDYCIRERPNQFPYVVEIADLFVEQKENNLSIQTKMNLLIPTDSGMLYAFTFTPNVSSELRDNETTTIADTLIRLCMQKLFNELQIFHAQPARYQEKMVIAPPFLLRPIPPKGELVHSDSHIRQERDKGRLNFILLSNLQKSEYSVGFGFSLMHVRTRQNEAWHLGGIYSYEEIRVVAYSKVGGKLFKVGFVPMRRIFEYFWVYCPVQAIFVNNKEPDSIDFFGADISPGVCFMSKRIGTFIGVRSFGLITQSILYSNDFGGRIDVGLKF